MQPLARNDEQTTAPLSRIEIDLGALASNVQAVRQMVGPDTVVCGVVKKNAYGLGAVNVAHRMLRAGCGMLAVYAPQEAEELNAGAITAPILLLFPLRHLSRTEGLYRPAVAERLHLTIHDMLQLDQVDQIGRTFGIRMPVHLMVDTGMSRSGLSVEQAVEALSTQPQRHYTRIAGVMSHLATASGDPGRAQKQLDCFDDLLRENAELIPADALIHIANTFGVMRGPTYHRGLVRPGLGLYGYGEESLVGEPRQQPDPPLQHTVRWLSRVVQVGTYARHAAVGYGATHKLTRKSVLGIVPVGYGDGYPLLLSNQAVVRIEHQGQWHDCPILGRVNMDQLTVDLTDLAKAFPDRPQEDWRDTEVELYSNDPQAPNAIPKLAELAQSHPYELLCRLSPRVPRVYV